MRPKSGDASACLILSPSVIRRSLTTVITRVVPPTLVTFVRRLPWDSASPWSPLLWFLATKCGVLMHSAPLNAR